MIATTFKERGRLKKRLNNRLKSDGCWGSYNELRAHLKQSGVDEGTAWLVAAFPFPPKDGSPAEIVDHPMYAEIAAGWENGRYQEPDGSSNAENADGGSDVEAVLLTHAQQRAQWENLAEQVGKRTASELEETRWVVASYLVDVSRIRPDDVPSAAALSILMWVQMSPSNFGDFIRTNHSKLLPNKAAIEEQQRYVDDGQPLKLLEDFERTLKEEGLSLIRDSYLSFDTNKQNEFKLIIQAIAQAGERLSGFISGGGLELLVDGSYGGDRRVPVPVVSAQLTAWDKTSALNIE